jgi:hypothetical protein
MSEYEDHAGVGVQGKAGIVNLILAFGEKLWTMLKAVGIVRTGGMVDTFDD